MFETQISTTDELTEDERGEIRGMLEHTFGERYDDTAWNHCLGGTHFLLRYRGELVSHGALVPRYLEQDGRPLKGVYGESMATVPELQAKGIGSIVVAMASAAIRLDYDIGAFGTSRYHFYERLGWQRWRGKTFYRDQEGKRLSKSPDRGSVMVLLPAGSSIDPEGELTTDWRDGDIW